MNFKYIISSLFLLFLAFGACTEDERGLETQGYLELGVSKNVEVITRGFDVEDQSLAVDICTGAKRYPERNGQISYGQFYGRLCYGCIRWYKGGQIRLD